MSSAVRTKLKKARISARWRGWIRHDATGKFSSRCVLPDRNSLADVIGEPETRGYFGVPHIGEDAAKTNAGGGALKPYPWGLLPVAPEHRVTGAADLGAILLEAPQHREIALGDHLATETLCVARAGPLLF